jgi:hypothetical protein
MALGPSLVLAEVAGSKFCPLSPSRRLLRFASPALPAAVAHVGGRDFTPALPKGLALAGVSRSVNPVGLSVG